MHLYQGSVFFLSATALICVLGLATHAFKDNLLECLGMGFLTLGCVSRVSEIWAHEYVPADWFMVHAGVGLFAIGAALKVILRNRNRRFTDYQRERGRGLFERFVSNNTDWQEFQAEERRLGEADRRHHHWPAGHPKGHL